jgi:hypothetical protein
MKYYIFSVCWSQTDHDKVIVQAPTKKDAENALTRSPLNPHHFSYEGEATLGILKDTK